MRRLINMLAIYLGALSVPAFAFAFLDLFGQTPEEVVDLSGTIGVALRLTSFAYGATALTASVALFGRRAWAQIATRLWMGTCLVILGLMGFVFPMDMVLGGALGFAGFSVFIVLLFLVMDRVVVRGIASAT